MKSENNLRKMLTKTNNNPFTFCPVTHISFPSHFDITYQLRENKYRKLSFKNIGDNINVLDGALLVAAHRVY